MTYQRSIPPREILSHEVSLNAAMSAHDLAESDFRLYSSLLEEIEIEIRKLKREIGSK